MHQQNGWLPLQSGKGFCFAHFLSSSCLSSQYKRKSTEGVSYFLFALVILGNTMYGMSVLLKNPDKGQGEKSYMIHHLPWLIGSLGTLSLDLLVSFKEKKKCPLLLGLWILLNPKYMLHFGPCWACREDISLNWFWSHDCVCWNTICSIKGPNTRREIGLLPAMKQECKELY